MNKGSHHRTVNGFTVIELLVCIFAVAILVSLLLPAVQHSRESSRSVACKNNLRQIGIAIHSMEATEKHFPAIGKQYVPNRYGFSCLVQLLPYLERNEVHQLFDFDESTSSIDNFSIVDSTPMPLWKCPSSFF
jgi:prepilin-type N-terminal cleavage/methylation domain-containing protein